MGLCGILAHHIGAQSCILTDGDTDTLQEMRRNVKHNQDLSSASNTTSATYSDTKNIITCAQLRWGRHVSTFRERFGDFDVIMGSDIIYVEEIIEPLFDTIQQLLRCKSHPINPEINCNGNEDEPKFLLAYARRNVNIELVFDCAERRGFQWMEPDDVEGVFVFTRHK